MGAVFHDPSGRRWLWCRVALVVLALAAVAGAIDARAAVFRPTTGVAVGAAIPWFNSSRTPVLGSGPMLRAARVVRGRAGSFLVDPFTRARLRALTATEAAEVGAAPYVVDAYGYQTRSGPSISLTFDDGPDPTWTPRLLDLLSRKHVTATFFLIGQEAVQHPDIVRRIVAEGHAIGIHTWSHPDPATVTDEQFRQELVLTERVLHAESGVATKLVRLPYAGDDPGSRAAELPALLRSQQLGYAVADYDVDTQDWATTDARRIISPTLDGSDLTLLLHDGGGNRRATLAYVAAVIDRARAAGYTFRTMPEASPAIHRLVDEVPPGLADEIAYTSASAVMVWPRSLVHVLFLVAVLTVGLGWVLIVMLATVRRVRRRRRRPAPVVVEGGLVSVVVAAYNEEAVIADTIRSVARSRYGNLEVVVVDDGSTDGTARVVDGLARNDPRVRLLRKPNGGKASALNAGFAVARGDVVVTVDADTQVARDTVGAFSRAFRADGGERVGAVAGVVKVGNPHASFLARWQALEYLTQIGLERSAQETLDAIMIVPGAGAAWRRRAVLAAGGFAEDTLAEDFDLSLTLQSRGWHVRQDDDAVCHTEAPHTSLACCASVGGGRSASCRRCGSTER
jgi:peptidoglycan-N-acetylglucosamine deacetylase